jgi:hypothetical protein
MTGKLEDLTKALFFAASSRSEIGEGKLQGRQYLPQYSGAKI